MSLTSEQLRKRLQATQHFVSQTISKYPEFAEVATEIKTISADTNNNKVTLEIFSQYPSLAESLNSFFTTRPELAQVYQFKLSNFPALFQPNQSKSPALILQANPSLGEQQTRYEFSLNQGILIVREPQTQSNSNIVEISLPKYRKVSGFHAEIKPLVKQDAKYPSWQICDLNSRNGTYVNNKKLSGCQPLQPGDRITLASPSVGDKYPEFVFEYCKNIHNSDLHNIEGDVVFLLIDPKELLSGAEKQLIENISKAQILRLIIIADFSAVNSQNIQHIQNNLTNISNWTKQKYPNLPAQVIHLPLQFIETGNLNPSVNPNIQQEYNNFCGYLSNLVKNKTQDILSHRLNQRLLSQIYRIEQVINTHEQKLITQIKLSEEKLQGQTLDECREHFRRICKKISEDREDVCRQSKIEINRSKGDLINNYSQKSLLKRIQLLTDNLKPVVMQEKGQTCIQLVSENNQDGNEALIQFFTDELTTWVNQQWLQICTYHHEGGINGLIEKSHQRLKSIPALDLSNPFSRPQPIDVQSILKDCFVELQSDASASYSQNNSNNQMIRGVANIGMQGMNAVGAYNRPNMNGAVHSLAGIVSSTIPLVGIAVSLVSLVGTVLSHSQMQKYKLEETIIRRRQELCNHYQNMTRNLVERLTQEISIAIDAEERRFKRTVDSIDEQFFLYLNKLKKSIEDSKNRQQILNQEKAAIEQIKRI